MENEIYGVIYKITNLVNGKIYIGQSKDYKKRWNEHKCRANNKYQTNQIITKAINKYGFENFKFEILDSAKTPEELNNLECYYIQKLNSLTPNGYNIVAFSDTIKITSLQKKKEMNEKSNKRKNSTSKYFGVSYINNIWKAFVWFNSKRIHIGHFSSEEDAAKARDIEVLKPEYQGVFKLNFPELKEKYLNNEIVIFKNINFQQGVKKQSNTSSKYVGVSFIKSTNKWRSMIYFNKNGIFLGYFDTEIEAALKYNEKSIELYGKSAKINII